MDVGCFGTTVTICTSFNLADVFQRYILHDLESARPLPNCVSFVCRSDSESTDDRRNAVSATMSNPSWMIDDESTGCKTDSGPSQSIHR
jgi:hypothetical protein